MQRIIFNKICSVKSQLLERCILIKENVVQAFVAKRASLQACGLHQSWQRLLSFLLQLFVRCLLFLFPCFSFTLLNLLCAFAERDPCVSLPSVPPRGSPDGLT